MMDKWLISLIYKNKPIRKHAGRKLDRRHKCKFTLGRSKSDQKIDAIKFLFIISSFKI